MLTRYSSRIALVAMTVLLPAAAPTMAHEYNGKAVVVFHPWARATPGGSTIGAAYLDIIGLKTAAGDKLVGASSPGAGHVEMHTHQMDDGVMKMRKIDSVSVSPGQTKTFAPGGDHLMLFDLKAPLKEGGRLPITLTFETSGEIAVEAYIESAGAMGKPSPGGSAEGSSSGEKTDSKGSASGSDSGAGQGSHDGH
jgi:periplasmic copper chaperone A